ncbi:MAG: HNH endonuclease [Chloroflexi bacterium]|nr:HNH endonuclease [Chloroflexota bacterium]
MSVTEEQRQHIRTLAGNCCEYCRVAEDDRLSTFQIDHIIPLKHGGTDVTDNLCLACLKCNGYKGPNVAALDPETNNATKLFDARQQEWDDHFRINPEATITGLTPEGRATVLVLRMNDRERVQHRRLLMLIGDYPC